MDNTEREQAMNEYQELYEGIELMCLCTDTYEDAEEYLKPLRELIEHYIVLEDAFTRACEHINMRMQKERWTIHLHVQNPYMPSHQTAAGKINAGCQT